MNKISRNMIVIVLLMGSVLYCSKIHAQNNNSRNIVKFENRYYFEKCLGFWQDSIDCLKKQGAVFVEEQSATDGLIRFGIQMNELIRDGNVISFTENLADELNWYGVPCYRDQVKIKKIMAMKADFLKRKGSVYERVFDFKQFWANNKKKPTDGNQFVDVRTYIQMYSEWITWKCLYFRDSNEYELWFSIPDTLIDQLGWFHYRIKIEGSKYIIIGI